MAVLNFAAGLNRSSWPGSGDTADKKYGIYLTAKALDAYYNRIGIDEYADTEGIPANTGDKVIFHRFKKKARSTTALSAGVNASPTARSVSTIEASLSRFGDADDIDKETLQTAVARLPEDIVKMIGIEAAETAEELVFQTIARAVNGAFCRMDSIGTNFAHGVTSATQSAVSTLAVRSSTFGKTTANYWKNALFTPLEGANAGVSRTVSTHSTGSGQKIVVGSAFEYNVECSIRFLISRTVGHTVNGSNQLLTIAGASGGAGVKFARMILEKNGAIPFQGSFDSFQNAKSAPRGDYGGVLTPEQYMDLIGDTVFQTAAQQGDSMKSRLIGYQIARFMGIIFSSYGLAWRTTSPTVGTAENNAYQTAGVVHCANFMGMHSYAMVKPEGYGGKGNAGLKIYPKKPGPQDTSQSNDAFWRIGWDMYFGRIVLNGAWGVTLTTSTSV